MYTPLEGSQGFMMGRRKRAFTVLMTVTGREDGRQRARVRVRNAVRMSEVLTKG